MDSLFGLDSPALSEEGLVCVGTFFDNASLTVALSILTEAEIPFLQKDRGTGGVLRILAGYNMFGADVFVREEDAEVALALLSPVEAPAEEIDTDPTEEDDQ